MISFSKEPTPAGHLRSAPGISSLQAQSPFFTLSGIFLASLLALSPSAQACDQVQSNVRLSSNHNVAKYEYNPHLDQWEVVDTWYDPEVNNYEPAPGDMYEVVSNGEWALYTQNYEGGGSGGGGGNPTPPPGGGFAPQSLGMSSAQGPVKLNLSDNDYGIACDNSGPIELPKMTVSGSSMAGWTSTISWGYGLSFGSGAGSPPPPSPDFPETCDTGNSIIDDHEDIWDELFEESNFGDYNSPNDLKDRREQSGMLIPDGDGGYTFDRMTPENNYQLDSGPCHVEFYADDNFPEGTIWVHTHPFKPGEDMCSGGTYNGRPSFDDRFTLRALDTIEDGIIINADEIILFQEGSPSDDPNNESRCGY